MSYETTFSETKADEKSTLTSYLRFHQDTLLRKLEGLSDEDLSKAMVPSGLSLIGLLKHATYVHARWFELCFQDDNPGDLKWPTNEWSMNKDDETSALLIDNYRKHCEIARKLIDDTDLEAINTGWSGGGFEPGTFNLRWIVVHMIEELARHNGHADILREQIDGTTGV